MTQMAPCMPMSPELHVILMVLSVVQTIALAYIGQRALRKNREDRKNGRSRHR